MKRSRIILILIGLFLIGGILIGCTGEERPAPSPKDDKEKIPPALTTMDEKVHSIIEQMEGIEDVEEIKPEDIKPQEEQEQQQQEEESPPEGGEKEAMAQQQSPEEEQEKIQREKQAQVLEKWLKSQEELQSLHESWNKYESTALKDGGDTNKIDEMERALNTLTSTIEAKEKTGVLNASNDIILSLSKFMDFYKGNAEGVLRKMEYAARQSYLDAEGNNWLGAKEKALQSDALVSALRQRDIEEEQKPLLENLSLSLEDLQKAITEENVALVKIKRDIVIKNLESLGEELK